MGAAKWEPIQMLPLVKIVNTPQYWLKEDTEGFWLIIKVMLDTKVIRLTISPL